jgi:hypothetical protein
MTISRWILLRMRNVSNKKLYKKSKYEFYVQHRFSESRAFYETMSKTKVKPESSQITWRMGVACCISKATRMQAHAHAFSLTPTPTHTHVGKHAQNNVILIAFPQHQWFLKGAWVLRCTYIVSLLYFLTWKRIIYPLICTERRSRKQVSPV